MVLDASKMGDIWNTVLNRLEREVDDRLVYSTYFEGSYIKSIDNGLVTVVSPSRFAAIMLKSKYFESIQAHVDDVTQTNFKVQIIDQDEADAKTKVDVLVSNAAVRMEKPFDSHLNPKFTFESFVTGPSNREACVAAVSAATDPGNFYSPLFIFGKSGLGKTHLLHAIGNYIKDKNPSFRVLYLTTDDFFEHYIKMVKERSSESLKEEFKNIDVLLLDDVQFLASKEKTRETFFHIFNLLSNNNKQIVLTADRPPQELKDVEDRLVGRFASGLSVEIQALEKETAYEILRKKVENQHLNDGKIDEDVLRYISENYSGNVRQLEGALNKLLFYAITFNKREEIDMNTALETFKTFERVKQSNPITMDRIKNAVAEYYNISVTQLTSKIRQSSLVTPRHIAMYLCKSMLDPTLKEIGEAFGGRDHTTVINAVNKVEKLLKTSEDYVVVINDLKQVINA